MMIIPYEIRVPYFRTKPDVVFSRHPKREALIFVSFRVFFIQSPSWGLHRAALDKLPQLLTVQKKRSECWPIRGQSMERPIQWWILRSLSTFEFRISSGQRTWKWKHPISSGKASCFAFQKVLVLTSTLVAQRLLCKSSQNLFCSTCGNKSESPWVIQWSNVAVTWSTIQVELELIQFSSNPLELNIPTRGIGRAWSVFFFALVGSLKSSAPSTLCTPASYSGAVVQPKKNTGTASKNGEKPWWMVNFLENIQPFSGSASVVGHTQIL